MTALLASWEGGAGEEEGAPGSDGPDEDAAGISLGRTVTYRVDEGTVIVTAAASSAVELDGVPFSFAAPPVRDGAVSVAEELAAWAVGVVCPVELSAVTREDDVELPTLLSPGTSSVAELIVSAVGETMMVEDGTGDEETRDVVEEAVAEEAAGEVEACDGEP